MERSGNPAPHLLGLVSIFEYVFPNKNRSVALFSLLFAPNSRVGKSDMQNQSKTCQSLSQSGTQMIKILILYSQIQTNILK